MFDSRLNDLVYDNCSYYTLVYFMLSTYGREKKVKKRKYFLFKKVIFEGL